MQPRLLLLDEPLSALDAGLRERLAADLRDILREAGTTALMVTHDQEEAFAVADRLAVMRAGRVVQQGDIAEVWRAPADAETALFLGYARVLDGRRGRRAAAGGRASRARPRSPYAAPRWSSPTPARWPAPWSPAGRRPSRSGCVVDVDGVGEVDAVARLDAHPAPGDRVAIVVDASRLAVPVALIGAEFPTLAGVYRRAYVLLVVNAAVMGAGPRSPRGTSTAR